MLSYHGLAHLRPFFWPKVFLLLQTQPLGTPHQGSLPCCCGRIEAPVVPNPLKANAVGDGLSVESRRPPVPQPEGSPAGSKEASGNFPADRLSGSDRPAIGAGRRNNTWGIVVYKGSPHTRQATAALRFLSDCLGPVDSQRPRRLTGRCHRAQIPSSAPVIDITPDIGGVDPTLHREVLNPELLPFLTAPRPYPEVARRRLT